MGAGVGTIRGMIGTIRGTTAGTDMAGTALGDTAGMVGGIPIIPITIIRQEVEAASEMATTQVRVITVWSAVPATAARL